MKPALIALTCAQLLAVDGDTVLCDGERVRLLGYDSPEMHARSERCRRKALAAWSRLTGILDGQDWHLEPKRTKRGTMARDKYRRILARLWVDGEDVAVLMVREGLARPYRGGKRKGGC